MYTIKQVKTGSCGRKTQTDNAETHKTEGSGTERGRHAGTDRQLIKECGQIDRQIDLWTYK